MLREAGHDVVAIAEISKGIPDERVMERAFDEGRVLITEDDDFGELVYARRRPSAGVILVKFDHRARHARLHRSRSCTLPEHRERPTQMGSLKPYEGTNILEWTNEVE